ncbi:hypothetical protein GCM10022399_38490 [Terrabacter ginsenosidimutans]|uniref:DUF308 domain-containing protein n=1 Tax=Terrabacter ginsenosidimutans TaxID=490575 RepID=A0ABP7EF62_9MICO
MSDRDLDAEFARIIAGWDDEAPDPLPRAATVDSTDGAGPADPVDAVDAVDGTPSALATEGEGAAQPEQPEQPEPAPDQAGPGSASGPAGPAGPSSPPSASGLLELPIAPTTSHAWRGSTPLRDDAGDVVDDGEHFVPPSEIDLPSAETDPMFWAIVGGLVGGPLLLLYVLFFDRDGSGWWVVTALTMIVVGFVLLVLRGGNERDPFDDGTRL